MTVSYQYDVASSTSGGFIRLLFRWRGSVWKLVYRELLVFTIIYFSLTMLYRFVLTEFQRSIFERIVFFCSTFMDLIPLSFVLGFYVSFIATRWWNQYIAIPWPDKLMNSIALYVPGSDETSRVLRRTMMRYLNVALILVLRSISMAVKRRFPTREHLVEAGFMTKLELEMLQSVPSTEFNTFWIPCTWFINLLREAKQECHITDSNGLKLIMEEFNEFRSKCGMLWSYDWISIPLVYTQVVTLATYAFFGACIFGRQYVESSENASHKFELYIPVFTIFQLFFYMGLLKVAEQLINPFGDDDEDFELNWIIDRHMKVSYLGVDLLNSSALPLVRDNYFYELDMKLPYTEASLVYKKKTYRGSVARMQIPQEKQNMMVPEFTEEDDEDKIAKTYGMGNRGASLWTLVGGQLNTRFSVSNQNLDTVTLESGSNNWKVSNPSLFNSPTDADSIVSPPADVYTMNAMSHLNDGIPNASPPSPQPEPLHKDSAQVKRSSTGAIKPKKKLNFLTNIRRRNRNPQNRWIAFQSAQPRPETKDVPLSLINKTAGSSKEMPQESTSDIMQSLSALAQNRRRRQSFDERNSMLAHSQGNSNSPRFSSLPDVQRFAALAGVPQDNTWDQQLSAEDNDSTSNLLVLEEAVEDDEPAMNILSVIPPQVTFTRASVSRSPSPENIHHPNK